MEGILQSLSFPFLTFNHFVWFFCTMERYLRQRYTKRSFLKVSALAAILLIKDAARLAEAAVPDPVVETESVDIVPVSERYTPSFRGGERICTRSWTGEATYYSHNGCVGCSPNQIMANGQKFRENEMTIAFMRCDLNSWVWVENLDSGLGVLAQVTDRGGFEKYGILADLSKGVANKIGLESRKSRIQITLVDC